MLAATATFSILIVALLVLGLYKFSWVESVVRIILNIFRFIPKLKLNSKSNGLSKSLIEFHKEYTASIKDITTIVVIFGLTAIQLLLDIVQPFIIFNALHASIPLMSILLTTIAIKISGMFAITPGGSGIVEGVNYGFYSLIFSLDKECVVAQTLLSRGLDGWLMWIISGIIVSLVGQNLIARKVSDSMHLTDSGG